MRCLVGLRAHHAVPPNDMGRDASKSNGAILDTVSRIDSKQGLIFAQAVSPQLLLDGLVGFEGLISDSVCRTQSLESCLAGRSCLASSALIITRHMDVNSVCRLEHAAAQLTLVPRSSCVNARGRGRDCLVPARRSCCQRRRD